MEFTLECQKRSEGSKPNTLRRNGLIPAVLYGHNGTESLSLTISAQSAETLLKKAEVNNTLIQLNVDDNSWSGKTLLREVQTHPWKRFPYHLSFFAVAAHGDIDVTVPLTFVGEPVGVKVDGGMLDTVVTELSIKCAPESIPEAIQVDVSQLRVGDSLQISQLTLPEGATALGEPSKTVATVLAPKGGAEEA